MLYAEMVANQEQPELAPNQLAYHLAQLTGHHHYTAHRALLATNPDVVVTDGGGVLALEDLTAAVAALGAQLLWGLA